MTVGKYAYFKKPAAAYTSGAYPDWDRLEKDAKETLEADENCRIKFCFMDIYTINNTEQD